MLFVYPEPAKRICYWHMQQTKYIYTVYIVPILQFQYTQFHGSL